MICFDFRARDADLTSERWVAEGTSLAALRGQLEADGEMDTQDRFLRRGGDPETWSPVSPDGEAVLVAEGDGIRVHGPRRRVTLTDADGQAHAIFVEDRDTLADVRAAHGRLVPADAVFTLEGQPVDLAREATRPMRGVTALQVGPKTPPFSLLLLGPGGPPERVEWPDGAMTRTVEELRTFLGPRAPAAGFLTASEQPLAREMEPHETLQILGAAPAAGQPFRIRIASLISGDRSSGLGGSDLAGSPAGSASGSGGSGGAGAGERLSLRETRDLLSLLGEANSSGPPSDWFDGLARARQEQVLLSFRHLHGLRFVPVGSERDSGPAYVLDRSVRPALVPRDRTPAVQVVLPMEATRYSAFASASATADSVRSMLSWNVGGSLAAEARQGAVALKSSYTQTTESSSLTETARLIVRVEYLVTRGEIVVDPDQVTLAPQVTALVRQLMGRGQDEVRFGLAGLLDTYGPYVPMRTLFGGKLIYRQERSLTAGANARSESRELKSELEAKVRQVTMTAKGGFSQSNDTQHADESAQQEIEVTMSGGDPALGTLPYRWADSLDHAPWWSVISFADVRPLFALLPRDALGWVADRFARDSGIAELLSGPLDWRTYAAQLADAAARPQPALPPPDKRTPSDKPRGKTINE